MYKFPTIELLNDIEIENSEIKEEIKETSERLIEILEGFKIDAEVGNISIGAKFSRYEIVLKKIIKVKKVLSLAEEISLYLSVPSVNISISDGKIGIEVPNKQNSILSFKKLISDENFKNHESKLNLCVGEDVSGNKIIEDISTMPHLLVSGTTGSGKSIFIHNLIASILYKATNEEVKFIMIDPKIVELSMYNELPHLLCPVLTQPAEAKKALDWVVMEMNARYNKLSSKNVLNISEYNNITGTKLPQIVIIIDELSDLMLSSYKKGIESNICSIAQKARAAGIHLILATQRPSTDVVTGLIKSNIPTRISFRLPSAIDSRTILGQKGAETLLGAGDMLYLPNGENNLHRIQSAYISTEEINNIVNFIKENNPVKKEVFVEQPRKVNKYDFTALAEGIARSCRMGR